MYEHYLMMEIKRKEMQNRQYETRPVKRCSGKKTMLAVSPIKRALALWLGARLIEMGEKLTAL